MYKKECVCVYMRVHGRMSGRMKWEAVTWSGSDMSYHHNSPSRFSTEQREQNKSMSANSFQCGTVQRDTSSPQYWISPLFGFSLKVSSPKPQQIFSTSCGIQPCRKFYSQRFWDLQYNMKQVSIIFFVVLKMIFEKFKSSGSSCSE